MRVKAKKIRRYRRIELIGVKKSSTELKHKGKFPIKVKPGCRTGRLIKIRSSSQSPYERQLFHLGRSIIGNASGC